MIEFAENLVQDKMASAADVRDIMGMAPIDNAVTKQSIIGNVDKKR